VPLVDATVLLVAIRASNTNGERGERSVAILSDVENFGVGGIEPLTAGTGIRRDIRRLRTALPDPDSRDTLRKRPNLDRLVARARDDSRAVRENCEADDRILVRLEEL